MDQFSQRPLNRDGFEIAIICALPLEANAVLCAMDDIWHDSRHYYGKIAGDDNCYDFGKIGLHNVVIVTLPSMGLVRASSASRSLKMSFGSIKLALLVGICGAVPYSKDGSEIVLGDVIIGETIVELDYGRQYPGSFKRKDTLLDVHGRPNEEILGLLQRWKVPVILETLRHGSMWHLKGLLQRLGIDYPGVSQDILFQYDDSHTHRGNCIGYNEAVSELPQSSLVVSCTDIICNTSQIVARHRLEQTIRSGRRIPDPAIHIGSIGTSNAVMKSAWHRDQHAKSEGIIGFEMEGAGVWDKFNCLVIKGVCDYADIHKNKIWQPYAAATAAAVAKEVLNQYVMPQNALQPMISNNEHFSSCMHITSDSSQAVRGIHNSASVYSFDSTVNEVDESPVRQLPANTNAKKLVLESLRFPQMHERAQQIESAHEKTYSWIFQANERNMRRWDDPVAWLSSSTEARQIYWISGKPGAGKSTLVRFLREKLDEKEHMTPWSQGYSVIRASYYSWSPGNKLQKSLEGLLRSLLLQILEKKPDLIPDVIDDTKWSSAQRSLINFTDWTNLELLSSLERCIRGLHGLFIRVLFFVDGLDEFESSDDTHLNLMEIFTSLTCTPNVKIFASSRPWNVFKDSFIDSPQLRLQDLTWDDMNLYVRAKFLKNPRFQYLLRSDGETAQALIRAITNKAEGVFLWVRLVVRDLLKGIRDGDNVGILVNKLEEIPSDLDDYFRRLISLIDPQHMREASIILQVALYEEYDFSAMHPLRLLDLSFIDDVGPGAPSIGNFKYSTISMNDREGLKFRLDSTIRRLNSRCMGLLECTYDPEGFLDLFDEDDEQGLLRMGNILRYQGLEFEPSIYSEVFDASDPLRVFMPTVDFLHRCCRDFLLSQTMQSLLHQCTEGPYDARAFMFNARTSQFLALQTAESDFTIDLATGIASYLICALSVPEWKNTSISIQAARILQPAIEAFVDHDEVYPSMWYIGSVLNGWHEEQNSFLTLSIDFDLRGYLMEHLTESHVRNKKGRPILDYVLRPRFEGQFLRIGNSAPIVDLLGRVLDFGANPNGLYRGVSVWLLFLSSMADLFRTMGVINVSVKDKQPYLTALRMMIDRGAALVLPCSWMSNDGPYKLCRYERFQKSCQHRWPADLHIVWQDSTLPAQPGYAVSDLLETFREQMGQDIDPLIALARTKMENLEGARVQT